MSKITWKSNLLFLLVLCGLYFSLNYNTHVFRRPESVHMWAMCDRASVARNYAEESMNFFLPRVNESREKEGITGLEFPFVNYTAAILYKVFGFNEFWYRGSMLLIMTLALLFAFNMAVGLTGNFFLSCSVILVWYLSPVLNYYSPGFIPDVASLGFILIAWYFFFEFVKKPSIKNSLLFFIAGALSCLIKITSLISIVVILVLCIMDAFHFLKKDKTYFIPQKKTLVLFSSVIFILVIGWYKYAAWLSATNNNGVFLMGTNTPASMDDVLYVWHEIKDIWLDAYYPKIIYILLFLSAAMLLAFYKKTNRIMGLITAGLWAGNLAFIALMFNQFRQHDYYIIALLPALLFQFLAFADLLNKLCNTRIKYALLSGALITIFYSVNYSNNQVNYRYDKNGWMYYGKNLADYYRMEPYLESLHIKRTDKIVSIGDDSPNIVLYLMNLKGWSDKAGTSDEEIITHFKQGAKYLITNDSTQLNRKALLPFLGEKTGQLGSIVIYPVKITN